MLLESLDTFIGLITVFLILSLIVSALGEGVSNALNIKGGVFKLSIKTLIGEEQTKRFFKHDSVVRLSKPRFLGKMEPRPPSYVPDTVIAEVILDLCMNPSADPPRPSANINPNTVDRAIAKIDKVPHADALKDLWKRAEFDVDALKSQIAAWFNRTGDRSTGWFRRRLGVLLFGIGFVAAVGLNADTIYMFNVLSDDATLRSALVDRATGIVATAREREESCPVDDEMCKTAAREDACAALGVTSCSAGELLRSTLPEITPLLGFDLLVAEHDTASAAGGWTWWQFALLKLLGWILTAAAVSLGAPFWFDLLQKIVQIRTSLKPTASSAETPAAPAAEGSAATTADIPRGRALIPTAAASDAQALDRLTHFASGTFGYNPVNLFWCARLAQLAYVTDADLVRAQLEDWEAEGALLSAKDTQCVVACTPKAAFIVFRGTEQNLADWSTDVKAAHQAPKWDPTAPFKVHEGFNAALEDIWQAIDDDLKTRRVYERALPIWLGGHSLGGALAALGALRLRSHLDRGGHRNVIACVHTIGQPRVRDRACAPALDSALPARYFRSVNNRDVVPRVPLPNNPDLIAKLTNVKNPLPIHEYAHAGRVIYFTDTGKAMMDPPLWYRGLDTLAVGLTKDQVVDALKQSAGDHSVAEYVRLHRGMVEDAAG
jgi:hypothetical protein